MTTAISTTKDTSVIVPEGDMQAIIALDTASRAAATQLAKADAEGNEMAKAMITARAMRTIRELLTKAVLADLMDLQGSALGFRTDKDSEGGYREEIVRDVMTAALIRGLRPTNNEINIIAGNLYVTKEGFARLLAELRGFENFAFQLGVPQASEGGALVPGHASWVWQGRADSMEFSKTDAGDFRIAVRVNKGMGVDAILGKAESKLFRRIYARCTGSQIGIDPDADPTV